MPANELVASRKSAHTELLYRALAAPIGISVLCNNMQTCKQELYECRRRSGDAQLDRLQFRLDPFRPQEAIWIIKGNPKDASQTSQTNAKQEQERPTTVEDLFG